MFTQKKRFSGVPLWQLWRLYAADRGHAPPGELLLLDAAGFKDAGKV